jgi:CHAD domain-containing protein
MAYRFRRKESVEKGMTRVATEELDSAVSTLEHTRRRYNRTAVHEARKSVKKTRAVLRLVRPKLHGAYSDADRRLQKVSRALSRVRDADVLVETFDLLRSRYPARLKGAAFARVRRALTSASARSRSDSLESDDVRNAARQLRKARRQARDWRTRHGRFRALKPGLQTAFRRARRAFDDAVKEPTDEHLHTWRKRVKTHWYHARLLEKIHPESMNAYAARLKHLERVLGEDHNLTVLKDRLAILPEVRSMPEGGAVLMLLIDRRQTQLRGRAVSLGRTIYAPKPAAFTRGLEKAWVAWRRKEALHVRRIRNIAA